MPKTKEQLLKEILKRNPHINGKEVIAGRELAERLKNTCTRRRGYHIALPMAGKNVRGLDDEIQDHRTIYLHQV